jgi:hypothetical protein
MIRRLPIHLPTRVSPRVSTRVALRLLIVPIAGCLLAMAPALPTSNVAAAQLPLPIPKFGIVGGVGHYDSGSTPIGALRVTIPLIVFVAEGSLGVIHPDENGNAHTYIIPEAQLQYQFLPFIVRPYIGVGGGWFRAVSGPDPRPSTGTASASAGVRISPPLLGFGLSGEVRFRGIGSGFNSTATEFTLGINF